MFQLFNRSLVSPSDCRQDIGSDSDWLTVNLGPFSEYTTYSTLKEFNISGVKYLISWQAFTISRLIWTTLRLLSNYLAVLCAPFFFVFLSTGGRIGIPLTKPESWVDTGPRLWSSGEWDYREAGFQQLDKVSRGWSPRDVLRLSSYRRQAGECLALIFMFDGYGSWWARISTASQYLLCTAYVQTLSIPYQITLNQGCLYFRQSAWVSHWDWIYRVEKPAVH